MTPVVVKVGGSLLTWPGLREAIHSYFDSRPECSWLIVPGGGATTDIVRQWDADHQLGEETSHWLAMASMTLNAHLLSNLLCGIPVVDFLTSDRQPRSIINPLTFCRRDDANPDRVPHEWAATSDAVAARVAEVFGINELVLLKSADPPAGNFDDWAKAGFVDTVLPTIVRRAKIEVTCINLRTKN